MEVILAALIGAGVALLAAWAWWGRALAGTAAAAQTLREERDTARVAAEHWRDEDGRHRTRVAQAAVEVVTLQERLAALASAETERNALAADLAALRAGAEARNAAHTAELARLNEGFAALAGQALTAAQGRLAEAAEALLTRQREAADAGLKDNRVQLAELIAPMKETLGRYEARLGEVEAARAEGYARLTTLLDQVALGQERVSGATQRLETVLRSSGKAAGRWGEEGCRRVLELAGLVEGVDFVAQTAALGDDARRPDFILTLPGGRTLVIDVKCSIDSYVAAAETEGDDRTGHLAAHARAVRAHATGLAGKSYEKSIAGAVDFVVLFVPGENFLSAAFESDRKLMADFMDRRLVLAGPINLIAVARTVAAMRDQARLAQQAAEIAKLGRELYDSVRIMGGNIAGVQKGLESAVTGWNKLVGQLDSRVVMRARRFEQLGATTGLEAIPELRAIEAVPLLPTAPELQLPAVAALAPLARASAQD